MHEIELADHAELNTLVNAIGMNDRTLAVFAIAPDSSPLHPVVLAFQEQLLAELDLPVRFSTLHYSDDSLFEFLRRFEGEERSPGRQVVMIFGLEQLPKPKLKREMEQLNLGRERIFSHDLVLVFWLNREAFLDEFRRRAADFWDWRGNVVTFVTCPPTELLLYPYLEWLIAENSYLKMSGVMQVNRQVDISLDQIYVSLQAEWVEEKSQSFRERVSPGVGRSRSRRDREMGELDEFEEEFRDEPLMEMSVEPASRQRVTKMMDVAEAIRQREYGVILGDPGAGKTTLLRYLARHFAIAHREGRSTVTGGMGEDLGGARLPILFRIADFAEKLGVEPELSLVEYLRRFYRQWEGGCGADEGDAVAQLLLSKMATGDCLLLLDGLDEVLDGENRGRVVRAIDRLVSDYPSNKFVITSRIAGYQEASLGSRFREFTITPMGNEQIKSFLGRWCLAIEVAQRPEVETSLHERDAEREAAGIFHAIETKPGVKRFAANPLLLTILALIHRNGTQMPQRRVELYALATKTLIEDWQLGRNVAYGAQAKQLTLVEEEVTALLAPLAFRMHDEKSSGVVTQGEVEEWLTPWMAELQGVEEDVAIGLVREFLRKVRETTGLFVERGPGVYGFMHLTFEEYYAARHIANNDVPDILEMIQPYLYEARWNEPILLALGYLSTDQKRVNRLLEKMFEGLVIYQPIVVGQEVRLKNVASDPVLLWYSEAEDEQVSEAVWKDLLFVGQILAEVKVSPKFCRQQVDKLVLTYVGLDEGFENEAIQQLLRLFRGIESFNGQLLKRLQQSAIDEKLSEEQRARTTAAILYVICGESGDRLVDRVTEIIQDLTPSLFNEIRNLMAELGLEMTPSLERTLEEVNLDAERRRSLEFITGLSYLRSDNYDRVIELIQPLADQADCHLDGFIDWALALAYEKKEDHKQGLNYYQQCSDKLKSVESLILWRSWGICYRSHKKYEKSLACFQKAVVISEQLNNLKAEAILLWHIGKTYQAWEKYDEAILCHRQSLNLYGRLNKPNNVANQWYWIGTIYQEWEKYEDAIGCQEQCLELRRVENDQSSIALSLRQLGTTYQAWGKYEKAIEQYSLSQDLYQQLEKEKDVSNLWYWIGDCYKAWCKYEKAIECQQQCLELRRLENDLSRVSLSLYQLGRIYQVWGKYEKAIAHHHQSLNLYCQLEKMQNSANQWYWIGESYKAWGKYEKAIECQQQSLELRQLEKDSSKVALSLYQLGRIYQVWGKYEKAIEYYQKSRNLHQKLERDTNVSNQWYWIGYCYQAWGKYEKAIESQQQCLELRQLAGDQSDISLSLYQLGRIYQTWGKYEEAIEQYQQSRDRYQKLEKKKDVANLWYSLGNCYKEWSKYEKAIECQQQCLELRQLAGDQSDISLSLCQLGRIYQAWDKYGEAIDFYQQSRDLYQQLDKEKDVSNQWCWMGNCYKDWGKYEKAIECSQSDLLIRRKLDDRQNIADAHYQSGCIYQEWGKYKEAIEYHQQSLEIYQQLDKPEIIARQLRRIADNQRKLAQETTHIPSALNLLNQAEQNLQQAIQFNTENDYQANLAYSQIILSLLYADRLRHPEADTIDLIHQFETNYPIGLATLLDLGQTVSHAEETLDISRAYLEIPALQNLILAETLVRRSLKTFQEFDRRKLQANAHKLLGEIYNAGNDAERAVRSFQQSREIYQAIDLLGKVEEVERLMG